jgi:DNA modification methylase
LDRECNLLAGHARFEACKSLGLTEVPTISLEHLNPQQAQAFMLADNRLGELSQWEDHLLAEHLQELSLILDFDVELSGFEMGEIDLRIESLGSQSEERDAADDLPPVGSGIPITRLGDVWVCGSNRILCGDAREPSTFSALMGSARAAMVFTDPPYNVAIEGNVSGFGAIHHREFPMATGEMTDAEFTRFLASVFKLLAHYSLPGSLHFLCSDWRHLGEMLSAGRSVYSELKNVCVWAKDSAGMGALYRSAHEEVFVFKNGRERHRNNVQLGRFGRDRSNVWTYPGAAGLRRSEEGNLLALHATPKPVAMIADAMMDCTARGDIVLDSFIGSGSTVIAAERTGRRCYGIELDPLHIDTAVRRWQTYTRDRALHAVSGRFFDEMEGEEEGQDEK